ncbi:hypothetical protein E2C01_016305 [Portunus trituberculatus]|uniref:Uncharacterized protein n=1 Tax=Portunus trituberculatus TaxID=210409 RepID=A0A5B7DPX2_PORTR|nr:hypothetical protein [Portunus trituberculatus]
MRRKFATRLTIAIIATGTKTVSAGHQFAKNPGKLSQFLNQSLNTMTQESIVHVAINSIVGSSVNYATI